MTTSTFRFASRTIPLPEAPGALVVRRPWTRRITAIAFLIALAILTVGSLLATAEEWSAARAREHAPPPPNSGTLDPNC